MDNNKIPGNCEDKLFKVRPIIESVRKRCLELQVEESVCIDEQIIPFKGHLGIKQYIKGKPCPWGLKVCLICEKSDYPYDFVLYQGSSTEVSKFDRAHLGWGASVIKHLAQRLKEPGHCLYFDNYFSSYQIFEILSQLKINAAGTVRINRFNCASFSSETELKKKGRGTSEQISSRNGDIVLVKWQDNRSVHLASNFVGVGIEEDIVRWDKKLKQNVTIKIPEIIRKYNQSMGGVDLFDQYMSYYRIFIKSRKWTLRVIFHFVDVAVCASYIEYKNNCEKMKIPKNKIMTLIDFKLKLGWCLTKVNPKPDNIQKRRRSETVDVSNQGFL